VTSVVYFLVMGSACRFGGPFLVDVRSGGEVAFAFAASLKKCSEETVRNKACTSLPEFSTCNFTT
jgi:hypothetical protein